MAWTCNLLCPMIASGLSFFPDVESLNEVRADGYASMYYFALPDTDAKRWRILD